MSIQFKEVVVTPEMAKKWLEKNAEGQRPVSKGRVTAFAEDMRKGNWKLTHQTIAFNEQGILVDGQHRLQAVVEAGVNVTMIIAHNPDASYHDPIDRGSARSLGQLMGIRNSETAALNAIRMCERGAPTNVPMTLAEAEDIRTRHAQTFQALERAGVNVKRGPVLGALVYAYPVAPEAVIKFGQQVTNGEMLQRGDPAYTFRGWLERLRGTTRGAETWAVVMATLNAIRYQCAREPLYSLYTGESGYRTITTRRRTLRVPNTPPREQVETLHLEAPKSKRLSAGKEEEEAVTMQTLLDWAEGE